MCRTVTARDDRMTGIQDTILCVLKVPWYLQTTITVFLGQVIKPLWAPTKCKGIFMWQNKCVNIYFVMLETT